MFIKCSILQNYDEILVSFKWNSLAAQTKYVTDTGNMQLTGGNLPIDLFGSILRISAPWS